MKSKGAGSDNFVSMFGVGGGQVDLFVRQDLPALHQPGVQAGRHQQVVVVFAGLVDLPEDLPVVTVDEAGRIAEGSGLAWRRSLRAVGRFKQEPPACLLRALHRLGRARCFPRHRTARRP